MANLFPDDLDLSAIMAQVEQAAQLLSEVAAERCVTLVRSRIEGFCSTVNRYALTLRLMLANLRKHNKSSASQSIVPVLADSLRSVSNRSAANVLTSFNVDATVHYTPEELGMNWSAHVNQSQTMPSAMPVWLQEGVGFKICYIFRKLTFVELYRPWASARWLRWCIFSGADNWLADRARPYARSMVISEKDGHEEVRTLGRPHI